MLGAGEIVRFQLALTINQLDLSNLDQADNWIKATDQERLQSSYIEFWKQCAICNCWEYCCNRSSVSPHSNEFAAGVVVHYTNLLEDAVAIYDIRGHIFRVPETKRSLKLLRILSGKLKLLSDISGEPVSICDIGNLNLMYIFSVSNGMLFGCPHEGTWSPYGCVGEVDLSPESDGFG